MSIGSLNNSYEYQGDLRPVWELVYGVTLTTEEVYKSEGSNLHDWTARSNAFLWGKRKENMVISDLSGLTLSQITIINAS